jgi:hypothetical protein
MTNLASSFSGIADTVRAFSCRACPPTQRKAYLLYSLAVTIGVIALAFWVVSSASIVDDYGDYGYGYDYGEYGYMPFVWTLSGSMVLQVADIFSLILLSLGCFVALPAMVASVVATERKTGTMDQLRSTPTRAIGLLFGFVLGAPARLFLLLVGPLILHLSVGVLGIVPLSAVFLTTLLVCVGAIVSALVGAALALANERGKGGSFAAPVAALASILGIASLFMASEGVPWAFVHPIGAINASYLVESSLWSHWLLDPWDMDVLVRNTDSLVRTPFLALAFAAAGSVMLVLASARRIAQPEQPLLSFFVAVGLFAIAAAALIFPFESRDWAHSEAMLVCRLILLPLMAFLLIGTQSSARVWALELRKGEKTARGRWGIAIAMVAIAATAMLLRNQLLSTSERNYNLDYGYSVINWGSLIWLAATAMTLPLFAHFATGRYPQASHRMGFWAVVGGHLVFQMICIAYSNTESGGPLPVGILLAVALPSFVVWRTYALRRRVLQST